MDFELLDYKKRNKEKKIENNILLNAKQDDKILFKCFVCDKETSRTISSLVKRGIDYKKIDLSDESIFMCRKHSQEKLNLKKYGVKNNFQRKEIINKIQEGKKIQKKNNGDEFYYLKLTDNIDFICQKCGKKVSVQKKKFNKEEKLCRNCKREKTNLKKYGVKSLLELKKIRDKSLEGTDKINISQLDSVKLKKKIKYDNKTEEEKKEIFKKIQNTILKKYGVENNFQRKEVKEKIKQTNLEKYGVKHPLQNKKIFNKYKQSLLKKYGVENNFQRKEVKEKIYQTNLERYGAKYPIQNKEIKEKACQTNLERYGVKHPIQNKEIKEKMINNRFKNIFPIIIKRLKINNVILLDDYKGMRVNDKNVFYNLRCLTCNTNFKDNFHSKIPRCPICFPLNSSRAEKEIVDFIKSLNINNIIENDRIILDGKELDIYLPDYNLAIEFDGLYWHSESMGKDKNYHLNKTEKCNEKGIRLIHIFEDEWTDKQEIIKSIIKIKLGIIPNKIYARKCIIKEVENKEEKIFLENNHLQGSVGSRIKLGLYYENELVSLLTFGKPRYSSYDWELLRFANKLDTSVIGGFAKLLKHFTRNYLGTIISYSDRRYFTGAIYENNGFEYSHKSKPSYFYIDNKRIIKYNRIKFQKHKLKDLLEEYDETLTEKDNMLMNGYDRIWDCGNNVYVL